MDVEIINPLNYDGWNDLVLTQPKATFFHSANWARVICNIYKYKPLYFTVRNKDKLLAVVPIMEIDSFLTGKRGVGLPFTDFCPPVIGTGIDVAQLWEKIRRYGAKSDWKYVEIRGGNGCMDKLSVSSQCYEHTLELSHDLQHLEEHFRSSCKRSIKKAQQCGVQVNVENSPQAIREFYKLNLITRKRHGLPPQSYSFFKSIQRQVIELNRGILLIARYNGQAIAGAICVHFGSNVMYKYAASDKRYQHLRPNNLVIWKALEWYCRQKSYSQFSFGRTDFDHEGLRRFKSGWDVEEQTVAYYQYLFQPTEVTRPTSKILNWQTQLLKKTPIAISKFIGSLFYRHMG